MKKCLSFLLFFCISFLIKDDVFALDANCTQEEQLRLRQLVNATDISYEFYEKEDEEGKYQGYTVRIAGFSSDFYIYNQKNGILFEYEGNSTISNGAFPAGGTFELPFYASKTGACKDYLIMTKIISLPNYNRFYNDPLCKGHETYTLCKKFTSLSIGTYDNFKRLMTEYIKSLENNNDKPNDKPTEENETLWDNIMNFFANNYMTILIIIIASGVTGIVIIEVRKRRSIL